MHVVASVEEGFNDMFWFTFIGFKRNYVRVGVCEYKGHRITSTMKLGNLFSHQFMTVLDSNIFCLVCFFKPNGGLLICASCV